jgi:hypothetical protein
MEDWPTVIVALMIWISWCQGDPRPEIVSAALNASGGRGGYGRSRAAAERLPRSYER